MYLRPSLKLMPQRAQMRIPDSVADFLSCKRIAVAGVSRNPNHVGNGIFRRFRELGYEFFPDNPHAAEEEGVAAFSDVQSIPGKVDGLMIATRPDVAVDLVRQCAKCGIQRVWIHRGLGTGSVSDASVREAKTLGLTCIAGGCPFMYCEPVDVFHRYMHKCLHFLHRVP